MARDASYQGRTALVAGGATGLGRSTARLLRERGARVAILDIAEEAGRETAGDLDAFFVRCDVTDPKSWADAIAKVDGELGAPTLVHLNAGIMSRPPDGRAMDPFDAIDDGGYRRVFAVNTDGTVYGLRAVLPGLERAGGGRILVTASVAGLTGVAFDPFYAMSKHALIGLVRSMAPALDEKNIKLNALCPGGIATPLTEVEGKDFSAYLMTPDEVAEAVIEIFDQDEVGGAWVKSNARTPVYSYRVPDVEVR